MAQADFTRIATNIGALNALSSLRTINNKLGIHQQRLSTGKRINSAADDPAGLTIATKMLARSEGLKVAMDNIGDAKNMLSVAEAGLGKITDILVQMRSKAEQAASDTLGASERAAIQSQLSSYAEQIDNVVAETKWNGVQLLDGTVNKRFQTGADEGEHTLWQLSQKHDADTLNISEVVTTADSTQVSINGDSFTTGSVGETTVHAGLQAVSTGRYSLEVLDRAATALVGKVNSSGAVPSWITSAAAVAPGGAGTELGNGVFTLAIDDNTAAAVKWTIYNADGGAVAQNTSGEDWSGGGTISLTSEVGLVGDVGLGLAVNAGSITTGAALTFEYIQMNNVKYEMNDGSGVAMLVDVDGDGAGTATGTAGYFDLAGATIDTGRGINFGHDVIADIAAGESLTFDYKEAGNWVVDVSTASKAASYMTTVNNALDVVNSSMADLGSLMARLTFKEEAVSVAQVNVEASYNRIMNADMALEQLEATKMSILQQTGITMLAQANTAPQGILGLFR